MKMKKTILSAAAIMAAAFFSITPTGMLQAAQLPMSRAQRDLTPALQQSLEDKVSEEAGPYLDEQDRRKMDKKTYIDLQQKFEYLPNYGPHNELVVSVKLGGVEYDPNKPGSTKGASTGVLRYLVFTYARSGNKWVEMNKPKWEKQDLGAAAAKQMTANQARGDTRQKAIEKAKARAAAAAAAAQKAANH